MDLVLVNVEKKSVNWNDFENRNTITIKGIPIIMGEDGFVSKLAEKAEKFDIIESSLTDEQKEIIENMLIEQNQN